MEQNEIKEIEPFNLSKSKERISSRKIRNEYDNRPQIVFGGGSRFNLPNNVIQKLKDEGKVVGFVVFSSGDVYQRENYFNAIDRGWKPLDSREYPELTRQYELAPSEFRNREEDYLIRKGGQIAMIRDKEIDDAENEYYDSERRRAELTASTYRQGDPRSVRVDTDERTRHRARF